MEETLRLPPALMPTPIGARSFLRKRVEVTNNWLRQRLENALPVDAYEGGVLHVGGHGREFNEDSVITTLLPEHQM